MGLDSVPSAAEGLEAAPVREVSGRTDYPVHCETQALHEALVDLFRRFESCMGLASEKILCASPRGSNFDCVSGKMTSSVSL